MHSHTSQPEWLTTVLNHVAKSRFAEASTAAHHFARLQAFQFTPTDPLLDYYAQPSRLERIKADKAHHQLLDDLITNAMRILGKHSVPELQNLCVRVVQFHQKEMAELDIRINHAATHGPLHQVRNTRHAVVSEQEIACALQKARRNIEEAQSALKVAERSRSSDTSKEQKKLARAEADHLIGKALQGAAVRYSSNPTAVQQVLTNLEEAHVKSVYADALARGHVMSPTKLEREARLDFQARLVTTVGKLLLDPAEQQLAA